MGDTYYALTEKTAVDYVKSRLDFLLTMRSLSVRRSVMET